MKCLVTGAGGFIGGHLIEHLLASGCTVIGTDIEAGPVCRVLRHASFSFVRSDVLDAEGVKSLIAEQMPEIVYHLAAQSFPSASWQSPLRTFDVNVRGTVHLLEAVKGTGTRVVLACSSAEYASKADGKPISEDWQLDPLTPYGVSKLAQDHVGRLYAERYGIPIVRLRPFYLIGPRKTGDMSSDFARGIVAIEQGKQSVLKVGNLDVVRDLLDVRDGVAAMQILAEKGQAGIVYNICAGMGYRLSDVLDRFVGLAKAPVCVEADPAQVRLLDEPVKIGDNRRLKELGWSPKVLLDQTLTDILHFWREAK